MVTRAVKRKSSNDFQIKSILVEAWTLLKGTKGPIWLGLFNAILIGIMLPLLVSTLTNQHPLTNALHFTSILISTAITSPIFAGVILIGAKRARGITVSYNDPFLYFNRYLPLATAAVIIFLLREAASGFFILHPTQSKMAGVLALFSVIVSIFLMLTLPLVADKKYTPIHALVESVKKVAKHWLRVFVLLLILGVGLVLIYVLSMILGSSLVYGISKLFGMAVSRDMTIATIIPIAFIASVWYIPYCFVTSGVIYQKLADQ